MSERKKPQKSAHWFEPSYGLQAVVNDDEDRWTAVVQFQRDGERLTINSVRLIATRALDVAAWRSFPLARAESQANVPHYYRLMVDHEHSTESPEDRAQGRPLRVLKPPPEGMTKYPDSFYRRIADVYLFHVEHGHPPAKRMAEDSGQPITKINRWVKEARARGLLAPARARGRAG